MTEDETKVVLGFIYAAFPREKASGQTVAVFIAGLADMDTDCVKQAAMEWVRDHKFPPALAELRGRAKELQDSRRDVLRAERATAALPAGGRNEAKDRALLANIQAWSMGLIDDETMMREGARINAEVEPIPSDAAEYTALIEADIAAMKARRAANDGKPTRNMGSALRGAAAQVATASRAPRFPTPPRDAGPVVDYDDETGVPRRRRTLHTR